MTAAACRIACAVVFSAAFVAAFAVAAFADLVTATSPVAAVTRRRPHGMPG